MTPQPQVPSVAPTRRALPTPNSQNIPSASQPLSQSEPPGYFAKDDVSLGDYKPIVEKPVRSSTLPSPPGYDNYSHFDMSDTKYDIPSSLRIGGGVRRGGVRSPSPQVPPPPLPPRPSALRSLSRGPSPAPPSEEPRGRPESRDLPTLLTRTTNPLPADIVVPPSPHIPPPELPPRPRSHSRGPSRGPSPAPMSPPTPRVVSPPIRERNTAPVLPSPPASKLESDIASALQALQVGRPPLAIDAPPPPRHPSRPELRSRATSPAPKSRPTTPAPRSRAPSPAPPPPLRWLL